MTRRVYVEIVEDGTLRVPCCPACGAPAVADQGDGGGSHCSACPWRGDGYVTMWREYPAEPMMAPAHIGGPPVLTGGRIVYRDFKAGQP